MTLIWALKWVGLHLGRKEKGNIKSTRRNQSQARQPTLKVADGSSDAGADEDLGQGGEQDAVLVVRHAATVLDLRHHVPNGVVRDATRAGRRLDR